MTGPTGPGEGQTLSAWFHDRFAEVAAARHHGDTAEVERILNQIEAADPVHGIRYRTMVTNLLQGVDDFRAGRRKDIPTAFSLPGELMCDFCTSFDVVCYYPFHEFTLTGAGGEWRSGDRMYACADCRRLVDADDWPGLRRRVGAGAEGQGVRLMWNGFRMNRAGPAVDIQSQEPG